MKTHEAAETSAQIRSALDAPGLDAATAAAPAAAAVALLRELMEKESRRSKALGELGETMRSHEASLQQAEALLGAAGWEGDEQANAIALLEEAEGELKGELKQAEGGRDDGQGKAKAAPAPAQGSRHSRR